MNHNIYSGGDAIDRAALLRRDATSLAECLAHPATRVVPVWRSQNLVEGVGAAVRAVRLPVAAAPWLGRLAEPPVFLGVMDSAPHFAADLSAYADPTDLMPMGAGEAFVDLRSVGALLARGEGALLAYARGLLHWHRVQRFCGRCGAATVSDEGGHMRRCTGPDCGAEHFPRTDPAVIVLVAAGDRCLLGRQARWTAGMYSTLAGFVEPGETAEEAVAREVMEETGVPIGSVRYHSSQPWPFPGSLMIGFMAEAERVVEPQVDGNELEAAGDRCLLGRQARWTAGMYSTLAGFVEPGETAEEAVAREVMEETGVPIGSVRYHSSQPWPFPGSLMIGFMAEAERVVEPQVDGNELEAAAWFSRAEVADFAAHGRSLPGVDSIARRLIEDWLKK